MKQPSLWRSFGHALNGVGRTWLHERNFRIHVTVAIAVAALAIALRVSLAEGAILVLAMGLVFASELLNTAIEALVDLVSPEYHEAARTSKDAAAGAVFLSALTAAIAGLLILGPPLWRSIITG